MTDELETQAGQTRAAGVFATTHWTVVVNAADTEAPGATAALTKLCEDYWFPLYAYVRRCGHGPDDARFFLERKVFGLAEVFGCAELVEADVNGELFPNERLTDGPVREKLDAFVEDGFWSELVGRLAERDLRAEQGKDITKLGEELSEEEQERLDVLEDSYWREFEAKGVDHVVVLKGGKG